ncbi:hypothetical protein [Pelomonas sp. BJYL3]|uniref:hypothetical protein n=1 Tax=Pelomonas sp. BJYL3 TaxID=2976697 RepID=UPI0022B3CD64|nr:hypothetical protein [Pelomonas sp. BJYL3]
MREVHGHVLDSKALVAERLCQKYVAIRAVHGTRTIDINSFYENGLIPLDLNQQQKRAREIFLSGAFPELSEENLRTAIASFGDHQREGRVYFEANEDLLIDLAGHYMLYGSEYLSGLAGHLGYARKYQRVLKQHGAPTLFVCDVPLSMLSPGTLLEFAGEALETLFQELLDGESFIRNRYRGAGFCIRQRLPPECIVGHCHPSVKRDPSGR